MDLFSVDESDAVYQSFRSKTTMGLEVGSLVIGGYGAVKGVVAFSGWAKLPSQISKIVRKAGNPGFSKIDNAARSIENFLGGNGKVITNADGDMILMRGNRKIRFDVKDSHGDKPHFHLGLVNK